MTFDSTLPDADLPLYEAEADTFYSIDLIAELTGVDTQTILRYQEQGFIRAVQTPPDDTATFDTETLRQLRRIEHLRATCAVNDAGLKLILDLLHEIEALRQERRQNLR